MLLKLVDKDDYQFLYNLLLERPEIANISHRSIPTFDQHVSFCSSSPYAFWFIIMVDNEKAGSIYKTKSGEIGIFIKKEFQGKGLAKWAIPKVYGLGDKKNLANVAPGNKVSKKLFKGLGFKKIQETYELI